MWWLLGTVSIIFLTLYIMDKRDEETGSDNVFLWICICAICAVPTQIAFIAIDYFGGSEELKTPAMFLPLFTFSGLAIWSTFGDDSDTVKNSGSSSDEKDITAEAMILATVLSEDDDDKDSKDSSSSGSSSSSSSSNSDDFFLL